MQVGDAAAALDAPGGRQHTYLISSATSTVPHAISKHVPSPPAFDASCCESRATGPQRADESPPYVVMARRVSDGPCSPFGSACSVCMFARFCVLKTSICSHLFRVVSGLFLGLTIMSPIFCRQAQVSVHTRRCGRRFNFPIST